ncbi:Beta-lactamase-related protein [Penicillium canescens]|nr:Beta-lactamase-related protein [Penicillium canescens]
MQEFIASGQEVGASPCININGEDNVVDIWGGYADASTKKPWEKGTVINVFSTTKLITNLAALMLTSRGVLGPEDKVAKHLPDALSAWQNNMTPEDVCDVEAATDNLARQERLWAPGTAMEYHGVTQGLLVGELVRRKTKM